MNEHRDAGGHSIDEAAHVNPFGLGGIAGFAVVTFASEHGDISDRIPGEVAA